MNKFIKILTNRWIIAVGAILLLCFIDHLFGWQIWEYLKLHLEIQYWIILLLISCILILAILIYNQKRKIDQLQSPVEKERINVGTEHENKILELKNLQLNEIQATAFIRTKWSDNEKPQNVEEFINELSFSEPRCSNCNSNFSVKLDTMDRPVSFECTNEECQNKKDILTFIMDRTYEQLKGKFIGEIIIDFEKFWKLYLKLNQ